MNDIKQELLRLRAENMFRQISDVECKYDKFIKLNGVNMINFSSNDYLGVSTDKSLVDEFIDMVSGDADFLFSSASARLLSGTSSCYKALEDTLAKIFNKDSALIFNTGYQCNLGVISALAEGKDVIFSDKLNHASIIDGMRLSGADFYRYKHLDYEHLEALLAKNRGKYRRAIIVSESVFSMDGDIADIDRLVELKKKYNALLMIDEAHAFCAVGDGLAGGSNGCEDVDIVTATFGKAVASFGAFCVANKDIIEYLTNKSRSFIFSTSIPPVNIMWTNWLLNDKRELLVLKKNMLEELTKSVHRFLQEKDINTVSETHIIPVMLKSPDRALEVAEKLKSEGFFVLPIRPPTVPVGTSRLRLSLTAGIGYNDVERLFEIIKDEV